MKRLGWIIVGGSLAVAAALVVLLQTGRSGPPTPPLHQQLFEIRLSCEQYHTLFSTNPPSTQGSASLHQYLVGENGKVRTGSSEIPAFYLPRTGEVTTRPSVARALGDRVYGHDILYYGGTGNAAPSVVFGTASDGLYVEADNPGTPSTTARPEFWSLFNTTSNTIPPTWTRPEFTKGLLISAGKDGIYFTHDDVINMW